MQELLDIDNTLQSIHEINKYIKKDSKKFLKIEDDPLYSEHFTDMD